MHHFITEKRYMQRWKGYLIPYVKSLPYALLNHNGNM